jgi:hypothetical protein
MKTLRSILTTLLFAAMVFRASAQLETAFTYQGRLVNTNGPLDGQYDFIFALYDDAGAQMGDSVTNIAVPVTDGYFLRTLDFGPNSFRRYLTGPHTSVGPGEWLEISVRTNHTKTYQTLSPRQRLTPTPYASTVTGALPSSAIEGNYTEKVNFGNSSNVFLGAYYGDGANLTNVDAATVGGVPAGEVLNSASNSWRLVGNAGTTPGTSFIGTADNQPLILKVNSERALRLEYTGDSDDLGTTPDGAPNLIGGAPNNLVEAGVVGGTIAGGGAVNYDRSVSPNVIRSHFGAIGGGRGNLIEKDSLHSTISAGLQNNIRSLSDGSTIGGGLNNDIQASSRGSTVAGGVNNDIEANSYYGTIGGGIYNHIGTNSEGSTISGGFYNNLGTNSASSTIGGGFQNALGSQSTSSIIAGGANNEIGTNSDQSVISGGTGNVIGNNASNAMIPGGQDNYATNFAFAAGHYAQAKHTGAFVWADSTPGVYMASTNADSVTMRACGGYRLFSNKGPTVGVFLSAGGGSWTSMSDRNEKEDLEPVNGLEVLNKVAVLPLATWKYKSQDASVRHIGPMAQDFKAVFAVGESETGITTIDADGVALAAIQGLNRKLEDSAKQKDARIADLEQRLERLEKSLQALDWGRR